jgi:hypothetical protein
VFDTHYPVYTPKSCFANATADMQAGDVFVVPCEFTQHHTQARQLGLCPRVRIDRFIQLNRMPTIYILPTQTCRPPPPHLWSDPHATMPKRRNCTAAHCALGSEPDTNGRLFDPRDRKYTSDSAEQYACRRPFGQPYREKYEAGPQWNWSFVTMDPGTEYWQTTIAAAVGGVQRAGNTSGVYVDQIASYCE